MGDEWTPVGLWLAVVGSGAYHGVNPGMGWPLAVSAGLMERSSRALLAALGFLAAGHLLAVLMSLLPFALLATVISWRHEVQIAASLLVIGFGILLLLWRRHPRVLARIRPTQLGLWSFAIAIAHGAGLMLVPIYLGLCGPDGTGSGHQAATAFVGSSLGLAMAVSLAHTLAMTSIGGLLAWAVYRYVGLKLVARSWFNLDRVWAVSLILVGGISLAVHWPGLH